MSVLRKLTYPELEKLVSWARDEGWEPGLNDAQQFWAYDADGFLAIQESGKFVGGGAIVRHNHEYGFMGLFIVAAEHRGHGLGRELWFHRRDTLLERLGSNGAIGLDGVDAMVPFYAAGGVCSGDASSTVLLPSTGWQYSNCFGCCSTNRRFG